MNPIIDIPKIPNATEFGSLTAEQVELVTKRVENELAATGGTELTFDHVLNINIRREFIAQKSTALLLGGDVVVTQAEQDLEKTIISGESVVQVEGPMQPESDSEVSRTHTISFPSRNFQLARYAVRHSVSDSMKLRGDWQFVVNQTFKAATESMIAKKENLILKSLGSYVPADHIVTATSGTGQVTWNNTEATPVKIANKINEVLSKIVNNSNIGTEEISKPGAYTIILPVKAREYLQEKRAIGQIYASASDVLKNDEGLQLRYSRKPRYFQDTWEIDNDAYIIPTKNSSIGYLATWDGGDVYPASVQERTTKGIDYVTNEWFNWFANPQPWSATVSTNTLIGKITGILPSS